MEDSIEMLTYLFWTAVSFFSGSIMYSYLIPKVFYKKDITKIKWWKWTAIILLPLGYIASESGWLVAEFGRQPWTIQDMMPTWVGVSDLSSSAVIITFFLFLFLFTALLAVEISILCKQIKKGPEYSK